LTRRLRRSGGAYTFIEKAGRSVSYRSKFVVATCMSIKMSVRSEKGYNINKISSRR